MSPGPYAGCERADSILRAGSNPPSAISYLNDLDEELERIGLDFRRTVNQRTGKEYYVLVSLAALARRVATGSLTRSRAGQHHLRHSVQACD